MRENLIITSSVLFSSPVQKLPSMTTFPDIRIEEELGASAVYPGMKAFNVKQD